MSSRMGFVLVALIVGSTVAIDEDSAKESPCLKITSAVDPDAEWFGSVQKWYYPLASRLDLYRSVHDLLGTDYAKIPEFSVYYDSCLEWGINSDGFTLNGFNGKTRFLKTTTVGPGTSDFVSEWPKGMIGRAYTTLTDNKTFAFTAACFADNQMSWNVFATTKSLDESTKQQIYDHAKSLGYNQEYFTEMRYDSCKSDSTSSGDLNQPQSQSLNSSPHISENEVPVSVPSDRSDAIAFDNGPTSLICSACKKVCSSFESKYALYKYYKKLRSYHEQ